MARVKGLRNLNRNLKRFFEDEIASKRLLDEIGKFVRDRIQAFTRSGRSITGPRPERLKPLSESYINVRRGALHFRTINNRVVPLGGPDPRLRLVDREFFDPERSNLTFTGQLLRSLRFNTDLRTRSVEVLASGVRRDGMTNEELAKLVAEQGRPFIGLDDNGVKRVKRMIVDKIRRDIRRKNLD